jgi:hypothetical protein
MTLSGTSLISITNQTIFDTTLSVKDVVTPLGEWDYNFLISSLASDFAFQVLALLAPKETNGKDNIG